MNCILFLTVFDCQTIGFLVGSEYNWNNYSMIENSNSESLKSDHRVTLLEYKPKKKSLAAYGR